MSSDLEREGKSPLQSETNADQRVRSARGSWLQRHRGKLLLSSLIGVAFIWVMNAGALPIVPSKATLAGVQWWAFGVYLVMWSVVHWIRAVRWQWLLAPLASVPRSRVVHVSFIGFWPSYCCRFGRAKWCAP